MAHNVNSATADALARFPKQRQPLPREYDAVYVQHYKSNRNGNSAASGLAQKMESWMHRRVAADTSQSRPQPTLEIGAGTLNHLPYERFSAPYDIVEPFGELYRSAAGLRHVRNVYADLSAVPASSKYERIISIATMEHVCDLPEVIARCGLLLADNGQLRVAIPSEGTLLWRLGWQFTTALEFRVKYKLDYSVMMKYEHVNTAAEIRNVLRHFFSDVECSVFGLSRSLSLYQFYACSNPDRARCLQYLHSRSNDEIQTTQNRHTNSSYDRSRLVAGPQC